MFAEPQTEYVINIALEKKGWCIDGNDPAKNVYFRTPKLASQKKKLKGGIPDYILYQSNTDIPIAIIEAKKGGVDLTSALEQATKYAELLKAPLIFATNGAYCESRFLNNGKELILNEEEVREIIREREAIKFLENDTNEIYTIPKEVIVQGVNLLRYLKI